MRLFGSQKMRDEAGELKRAEQARQEEAEGCTLWLRIFFQASAGGEAF